MAKSSVDLIVNAVKAVNPLRAVAAASKKAEQAIDSLKKAAKDTGDKLADMGRRGKKGLSALAARARTAAGSFGKLGKAAVLAAAAAGAAAFLKFSFGQAGELERQTKSLQVLTGSLDTAKGIISELQAFGAVTPFTSTELIETAKRLKAFGFQTEQVVDITKRLSDVAGATGADLSGIATAFGQIQAKGRLQGEELLQLQERGVALGDELKKMYGLTGEEFSKALQKGQISAKAAEVALIRLTEKGGQYANGAIAQSDTLFGKLSTLQDALQRFGQNIGKVLDPIFKGIIEFLTTITNQINNLFREAEIDRLARAELGLGRGASGASGVSRANVAGRRTEAAELEAIKKRLREEGAAAAPTIADTKIPELTAGTAGAGSKKKTPAERAADATKKTIANLKEQAVLATGLTQQEKEMLKLKIEIQKAEDNRTLVGDVLTDQHIEALENAFGQKNVEQSILKLQENQAKLKKKAQDEEKKRVEELKDKYKQVGDAIKNNVTDAIISAIDGTKSLGESALGIVRDLANQFLRMGINQAFGALGGGGGLLGMLFGGGKASGGTVQGGRSYMVGERGPELFTPGRTGSIAPTGSFGGANIVVNVDASGSNVEGDRDESKALGKAIAAAVQSEIARQKRPGGLLS